MFPFFADAVEIYFIKSINAYQATLGPTDYETLTTIEEFCKWLVQNGEKQVNLNKQIQQGAVGSWARSLAFISVHSFVWKRDVMAPFSESSHA